jgi:hypothetical protein
MTPTRRALTAALTCLLLGLGLLASVSAPAEAARQSRAKVTINSVGERYVGAPIPIVGYLLNAGARHDKTLYLQRKVGRSWQTTNKLRHRADGKYRFASKKVYTPGTARWRVVAKRGHRLLDVSNTLAVKVIRKAPATCTNSPSPTTCPEPAVFTQTRTVETAPSCLPQGGGTVTLNNQARKHGWHWSAASLRWVAAPWSDWATVSTDTRDATTDECPPLVPKPDPTVETQTVDDAPYCEQLTVAVLNQERTTDWVWDTTLAEWVQDVPGPWLTVSQTTRAATADECLDIIDGVPADAVLSDLRIKNLNKCGAGDLAATGGDCFKVEYNANGRKLLKFPVMTFNVGAAPSEIIADRSAINVTDWKGYETFFDAQGNRLGSVYTPGVEFYFAGDGHNHWHVRDFDEYDLLDSTGASIMSGEKHGYCLQDNTTYNPMQGLPGVPIDEVYLESTSCGKGLPNALTIVHGLSRGWGDTYPSSLPDQALDITGIPDGTYTVRVHADARGAVTESDEDNNTATMQVTITGDDVVTHPETATGGLS